MSTLLRGTSSLALSQQFAECFVLTANQVIFALQNATKIMRWMNNWLRVSVRAARGSELAVAAIQQGLGVFCLVFKSNLISWLSVEYCNNSAVNKIKSQFAEMASAWFMEKSHDI